MLDKHLQPTVEYTVRGHRCAEAGRLPDTAGAEVQEGGHRVRGRLGNRSRPARQDHRRSNAWNASSSPIRRLSRTCCSATTANRDTFPPRSTRLATISRRLAHASSCRFAKGRASRSGRSPSPATRCTPRTRSWPRLPSFPARRSCRPRRNTASSESGTFTGARVTTTCGRSIRWSSIEDAASVDVAFTIVEGRQSIVAGIAVEGNRKTSERLVRGQVELAPSQPLDLAVLARSRRNLYGTGAFSIADITREDVESDGPAACARGRKRPTARTATIRSLFDLNVSVREVQPVQLRYGLSYDTEGGLGGILDLSVHNSLGKARVFGMQGRYDSEIHDGRVYVSQPSLRSWPRKTTASVYFREDLNPPTEQTDPFDISRQGASIQQEVQFRKVYVWSYGYRYELATTLEPSLGVGVTETVRVTPLTGTLTRETRDEVLDASKGTFLSQAFAYSPSWLGSDRPYLKYYGQYFHYFPLRPEKPKPFTNEILRTATGVRHRRAHRPGSGSRRRRADERALLRRRQHDPAWLRTECGRPGWREQRAGGRQCLSRAQQRAADAARPHRRWRGVPRRRQRVSHDQGLLVHRPSRVGRHRHSRAHAVGRCCAATTAGCSTRVPARSGAASTSASGRRSDQQDLDHLSRWTPLRAIASGSMAC